MCEGAGCGGLRSFGPSVHSIPPNPRSSYPYLLSTTAVIPMRAIAADG